MSLYGFKYKKLDVVYGGVKYIKQEDDWFKTSLFEHLCLVEILDISAFFVCKKVIKASWKSNTIGITSLIKRKEDGCVREKIY